MLKLRNNFSKRKAKNIGAKSAARYVCCGHDFQIHLIVSVQNLFELHARNFLI